MGTICTGGRMASSRYGKSGRHFHESSALPRTSNTMQGSATATHDLRSSTSATTPGTRLQSHVSLYKTCTHVNMSGATVELQWSYIGATVELIFFYNAGLHDRADLQAHGMLSSTEIARIKSSMSRAMKGISHLTYNSTWVEASNMCPCPPEGKSN